MTILNIISLLLALLFVILCITLLKQINVVINNSKLQEIIHGRVFQTLEGYKKRTIRPPCLLNKL